MHNENECFCYKYIAIAIDFKHHILLSRIPELILDQRNIIIVAKSNLIRPIYVVNEKYFTDGQMHYRYGWEKSIFRISKIFNHGIDGNQPAALISSMFPMHNYHTLFTSNRYRTDKNLWLLNLKKYAMNPLSSFQFIDGRHDFYNFRLLLCQLFQNNLKNSRGMNSLNFKCHAKYACVFEFMDTAKIQLVTRDISSNGSPEYVHEESRISRQLTYPYNMIWYVQKVKLLYPLLVRNYYT